MERTEDEGRIADWFSAWDRLVDAVDFVPARALFDPGVVGFGTRMDTVVGLEALERDQWRRVWPTITGFRFDLDTLVCQTSPDRLQGVGIVVWHSTGYHADGTAFDRPGRATVVFRRGAADEPWKGVHTHISLNPGTPQVSHGKRAPAS
ncbi:MAG: nuclear transport factor 2 family protein [Rhodospirillaceae bacterium]